MVRLSVPRGSDGGGGAEEGDRGAEGEGPRGGARQRVDQHAAGEPQVREGLAATSLISDIR